MSWSGRLLHIHIAKRASFVMEELDEATLIAGRGIEGDRYFNGTGTYSPKPDVREVTLIEMEVLDAMARGDPPGPGEKVELAPGDHRRNLTTLGVPLNHLVGKRFKIGEAVLTGGRLNFPCKYLEKLLGRPVYTPLLNRSGLNSTTRSRAWLRNMATAKRRSKSPKATIPCCASTYRPKPDGA
jgi:MOSC domain-containing protein YiiM